MKGSLLTLTANAQNAHRRIELTLAAVSSVVLLFAFSGEIKQVLNSNSWNLFSNGPVRENNLAVVSTDNKKQPFDVSSVVTAALAFKATLSTSQQSSLQLTYTTTLARKWSNLPCGSSCRNGVQFGALTSAQLEAALSVVQAALGSGTDNGYDEFLKIRLAEDWLGANGGGTTQYNSGLRWIAFLNTPSETGSWMLQFGGHHYAANIAFNNGHVIGATPFFVALEPASFTLNGSTYAPMEDERAALRSMLASLSATEFSTAKLSTTFSDCLMSPGESNGNTNTFPATKQGIKCSNLTTAQKNLVIAAIEEYISDLDATTAAAIMEKYTNEIDDTYIAFTGSATVGSASTFLSSNTNYARIDGPSVWIEFACQNGVVVQNQIHYHSVWRDHESDYGDDLTGDPIDETSLGVAGLDTSKIILYPNPATDKVYIQMPGAVANAKVTVTDVTGKKVLSHTVSGSTFDLDVHSLAKGTYILKVADSSGKTFNSKFIK